LGESFPRESWFDVRELEPGVHLVGEPGHVNSFLVQGVNSAVLPGHRPRGRQHPRGWPKDLTDKPLLVVNSHYHFDHSGGNRLFDQIAIHREGAELLERPAAAGLAKGTWSTPNGCSSLGPYKRADDLYFHLLTVERLVRPLPDGFDPAGYRVVRRRRRVCWRTATFSISEDAVCRCFTRQATLQTASAF